MFTSLTFPEFDVWLDLVCHKANKELLSLDLSDSAHKIQDLKPSLQLKLLRRFSEEPYGADAYYKLTVFFQVFQDGAYGREIPNARTILSDFVDVSRAFLGGAFRAGADAAAQQALVLSLLTLSNTLPHAASVALLREVWADVLGLLERSLYVPGVLLAISRACHCFLFQQAEGRAAPMTDAMRTDAFHALLAMLRGVRARIHDAPALFGEPANFLLFKALCLALASVALTWGEAAGRRGDEEALLSELAALSLRVIACDHSPDRVKRMAVLPFFAAVFVLTDFSRVRARVEVTPALVENVVPILVRSLSESKFQRDGQMVHLVVFRAVALGAVLSLFGDAAEPRLLHSVPVFQVLADGIRALRTRIQRFSPLVLMNPLARTLRRVTALATPRGAIAPSRLVDVLTLRVFTSQTLWSRVVRELSAFSIILDTGRAPDARRALLVAPRKQQLHVYKKLMEIHIALVIVFGKVLHRAAHPLSPLGAALRLQGAAHPTAAHFYTLMLRENLKSLGMYVSGDIRLLQLAQLKFDGVPLFGLGRLLFTIGAVLAAATLPLELGAGEKSLEHTSAPFSADVFRRGLVAAASSLRQEFELAAQPHPFCETAALALALTVLMCPRSLDRSLRAAFRTSTRARLNRLGVEFLGLAKVVAKRFLQDHIDEAPREAPRAAPPTVCRDFAPMFIHITNIIVSLLMKKVGRLARLVLHEYTPFVRIAFLAREENAPHSSILLISSLCANGQETIDEFLAALISLGLASTTAGGVHLLLTTIEQCLSRCNRSLLCVTHITRPSPDRAAHDAQHSGGLSFLETFSPPRFRFVDEEILISRAFPQRQLWAVMVRGYTHLLLQLGTPVPPVFFRFLEQSVSACACLAQHIPPALFVALRNSATSDGGAAPEVVRVMFALFTQNHTLGWTHLAAIVAALAEALTAAGDRCTKQSILEPRRFVQKLLSFAPKSALKGGSAFLRRPLDARFMLVFFRCLRLFAQLRLADEVARTTLSRGAPPELVPMTRLRSPGNSPSGVYVLALVLEAFSRLEAVGADAVDGLLDDLTYILFRFSSLNYQPLMYRVGVHSIVEALLQLLGRDELPEDRGAWKPWVANALKTLYRLALRKTSLFSRICVQAQRCGGLVNIAGSVRIRGAIQDIPPAAGVRVLSIDTGGSRSIVELASLARLEEMTGLRVSQMFDLIISTSFGAFIGAALSAGVGAVQLLRFFPLFCEAAFDKNAFKNFDQFVRTRGQSRYDDTRFNNILKAFFGERPLELDAGTRPAFVSYSVNAEFKDQIFFFSTHPFRDPDELHRQNVGLVSEGMPLWQVLRAAAATPTFFDPVDVDLEVRPSPAAQEALPVATARARKISDGSTAASNPSLLAFSVARALFPRRRIDIVMSLGAGITSSRNGTDVFNWGYGIFSAVVASTQTAIIARQFAEKEGADFFRVSPVTGQAIARDKSEKSIRAIGLNSASRRKIRELGEVILEELEEMSYHELLKTAAHRIRATMFVLDGGQLDLSRATVPQTPRRESRGFSFIKNIKSFQLECGVLQRMRVMSQSRVPSRSAFSACTVGRGTPQDELGPIPVEEFKERRSLGEDNEVLHDLSLKAAGWPQVSARDFTLEIIATPPEIEISKLLIKRLPDAAVPAPHEAAMRRLGPGAGRLVEDQKGATGESTETAGGIGALPLSSSGAATAPPWSPAPDAAALETLTYAPSEFAVSFEYGVQQVRAAPTLCGDLGELPGSYFSFELTVRCVVAGTFIVDVLFRGHRISGSPFRFVFRPARTNATVSAVLVPQDAVRAGATVDVPVYLADAFFNETVASQLPALKASATDAEGSRIACGIRVMGQSSFIRFEAPRAGHVVCAVTLGGQHITNSPFRLAVAADGS